MKFYDPFDLLKAVIKSKPKASEAEHRADFNKAVRADDDLLDQIINKWFDHRYQGLLITARPHETIIETQQKRRYTKRAAPSAIREAAEVVRQTLLLDTVLSTGLLARNATKSDLEKESDFWGAVARNLEHGQVLGKHVTERQLQAIHKRMYDPPQKRRSGNASAHLQS